MKRAILLVGALGIAAHAHAQQPRAAPQPASDTAAAHVHMEAQAPPPAAPQGRRPRGGPAPSTRWPAPDAADRGAVERRHPGRHPRTRRPRAQGVAAAWRVGRHQDEGRHRAEGLGRLSGAAEQDRRRARHSRHLRHARPSARGGRPARAGRIHRHRSRLPLRQGPERRRFRFPRHRREPGDHVAELRPT